MLTIEELHRDACKWPLAEFERGVYLFCGKAASVRPSGRAWPYCACHALLAYRAPNRVEKTEQREVEQIGRAAGRAVRRTEIDTCEVAST